MATNIFEPLNDSQVNVDMVIQNISSDNRTTDVTFTIKRDDLLKQKIFSKKTIILTLRKLPIMIMLQNYL